MREEMSRALGETDKKMVSIYKDVHDHVVQAKAAFLPVTRAIPRLAEACAALEAEAVAALERLRSDDAVLQRAQVGTVAQLHAEREGLVELMRAELKEMEEGSNYSLQLLLAVLGKEREALRASEMRCASECFEREEMRRTKDAKIASLQKQLQEARAAHEAAAEQAKRFHEEDVRALNGKMATMVCDHASNMNPNVRSHSPLHSALTTGRALCACCRRTNAIVRTLSSEASSGRSRPRRRGSTKRLRA